MWISFFIFSLLSLISGIMVISSINPVHSVFWLVVTFINSAALFILLELDFMALMLIIIYVGAIAILFLFVIMMLNLAEGGGESDMLNYAPIGLGLGTFFLGALVSGGGENLGTLLGGGGWDLTRPWVLQKHHNIEAIGRILYSDCYYLFILVSFILLVAMIGAIVKIYLIKVMSAVKRLCFAWLVPRSWWAPVFLLFISTVVLALCLGAYWKAGGGGGEGFGLAKGCAPDTYPLVIFGVAFACALISWALLAWMGRARPPTLWLAVAIPFALFIFITWSLQLVWISYGLSGGGREMTMVRWFLLGFMTKAATLDRLEVAPWGKDAPNLGRVIGLTFYLLLLGLVVLVSANADSPLPHPTYKASVLLSLALICGFIGIWLFKQKGGGLKLLGGLVLGLMVVCMVLWCGMTKEEHDAIAYISECLKPFVELFQRSSGFWNFLISREIMGKGVSIMRIWASARGRNHRKKRKRKAGTPPRYR